MVRVTGNLSLDGDSIVLNQGGNSTTFQAGSPAGDITITLPSTSASILVNPMDSAGDMMYGGASGLVTKLDSGTVNYMLQANGAAAPTWNLILNANVDAAAAIALSKLATLTVSRALVSDGSGLISAATTTSTQIGYLSASTGTTGTTSTNIVFSTSPTLVTPTLGVASATSINKLAITAPATSATLTIADGKTLTASNTLTLTGTDASSIAFGAGGTVTYTSNKLSVFSATTSAELRSVLSDETGSGLAVFNDTPTLIAPTLGVATATSVNKVAITAPATSSTLTIADGKTLTASNTLTFTGTDASSVAFGTGGTVVYTANKLSALAVTSSSELAGVISDETGTGALVFANTPTLVTPVLGAATATSINGNTISTGTGTLTLGAGSSLVTSATNSVTLTSTGATNVTLPTTGTLATLGGIETFSGAKTLSAKATFTGSLDNTTKATTNPAIVATSSPNSIWFGHSNGEFNGILGALSSAGQPFVGGHFYHSSTSNQLQRSGSTNTPNWVSFGTSSTQFFGAATGATDSVITSVENGFVLASTGAWTLGPSGSTTSHSINGLIAPSLGLRSNAVSGADANTTLVVTDNRAQLVTPTANRTYTLPTTSILKGDIFEFTNSAAATSAFTIIINSSGGNLVRTVFGGTSARVQALQDTPTTAAHWACLDMAGSSWIAFTPSWTGLTGTAEIANYRRVGTNMEIVLRYNTATTSTSAALTIPGGFTSNAGSAQLAGVLWPDAQIGTQTSGMPANAYVASSTTISFYTNGDLVGATNRELSADIIGIQASFPITNWTATKG